MEDSNKYVAYSKEGIKSQNDVTYELVKMIKTLKNMGVLKKETKADRNKVHELKNMLEQIDLF